MQDHTEAPRPRTALKVRPLLARAVVVGGTAIVLLALITTFCGAVATGQSTWLSSRDLTGAQVSTLGECMRTCCAGAVEFSETGLGSGKVWKVVLSKGGATWSASGKSTLLTFSLCSGRYSYTITAAGYSASQITPSHGTVGPNGLSLLPVVVHVKFT